MSEPYYNNPRPLSVLASKELPPSDWMPPTLYAFAGYAFLGTLMHTSSRSPIIRFGGKVAYAVALVTLIQYIQNGYQQPDSGKGL